MLWIVLYAQIWTQFSQNTIPICASFSPPDKASITAQREKGSSTTDLIKLKDQNFATIKTFKCNFYQTLLWNTWVKVHTSTYSLKLACPPPSPPTANSQMESFQRIVLHSRRDRNTGLWTGSAAQQLQTNTVNLTHVKGHHVRLKMQSISQPVTALTQYQVEFQTHLKAVCHVYAFFKCFASHAFKNTHLMLESLGVGF